MADTPTLDRARVQREWKLRFARLLEAARSYARSGSQRNGHHGFLELSAAAIGLHEFEEQSPLLPLVDMWPRDGWEKLIHEAAIAWAELSICMPHRDGGSGEYATLSIQRMRGLQQAALAGPTADTLHDLALQPPSQNDPAA